MFRYYLLQSLRQDFKSMQRLYLPSKQYTQFKHGTIGHIATLEPALIVVVPVAVVENASSEIVKLLSVIAHSSSTTGGITFRCPFRTTRTSSAHTAQGFT